jgi:Flp pilus assembly protein TadD
MKHGDYTKALDDYKKSLKLAPREWIAYHGLARVYATAPVFEAHIRDGKRALEMAEKACELSLWNDWMPLTGLAAAYAELGDFESAVKWQTKAVALSRQERELARREIREQLEAYQAGRPYYDEPIKLKSEAVPASDVTGGDKKPAR